MNVLFRSCDREMSKVTKTRGRAGLRSDRKVVSSSSEEENGEQNAAPAATQSNGAVDVRSPNDTSGISVTITTDGATPAAGGAAPTPKYINIFHEQFAGVNQYPLRMLRIFAKEELEKVTKEWTDEKKKQMYPALLKAIPDLSMVFGKPEAKWPEPSGFTPNQVSRAYASFLEFFLANYLEREEAMEEMYQEDLEATRAGGRKRVESEESEEEEARSAKKKKKVVKKKKKSGKKAKKKNNSSSSDSDSPSESSSSDSSSSSSESSEEEESSSSEDSSDDDSSEEERVRRRKKKAARKKRRKRREAAKKKKRKGKKKKRSKKKRKKAFKERVQAVEYSQNVGQKKYSKEHLYSCREMLKAYRVWANPRTKGDQKATVPMAVRQFIDRYLADEDANILKAYDLPHVKGSQSERKHVTFLMNKMGKLASKVADARLQRARMALDKHNRLIEGAKLSKKERSESIKSECEWAGQIRWYSELVSQGEALSSLN